MRPIRITGDPQAVIANQVSRLIRKFEYPFTEPFVPADQGDGGGGEMTVAVAAASASDLSKSKADIVCTGVNDDGTINGAWDLAGVTDAHVVLSEGVFNIGADVIVMPDNATLSGKGWQTRLSTTATSGTLIEMTGRNLVANLQIQRAAAAGNTLIGIELGELCQVFQVRGEQLQTFIGLPGASDCYVGACFADTCNEFITASAGFEQLLVIGNQAIGVVDLGTAFYARVIGNRFQGGSVSMLQASAGAEVVIADNQFVSSSDWDIEVSGVTDWIIANNASSLGTNGISVAGDRVSIVGNSVGGEGFLGGDGIEVVGNQNSVLGNIITMPGQDATNTFDGIRTTGNENHVQGNRVIPHADTRYGINIVSGNDNAVFANYLGDASVYGTADYVDGGTGTITTPDANGQFTF